MPGILPKVVAAAAGLALLLPALPANAGGYGHNRSVHRSGFLSSHIGGRHLSTVRPGSHAYGRGSCSKSGRSYGAHASRGMYYRGGYGRHYYRGHVGRPYVGRHSGYYCGTCNFRHSSRLRFYDHMHRHHGVARSRVGERLRWSQGSGAFVYLYVD